MTPEEKQRFAEACLSSAVDDRSQYPKTMKFMNKAYIVNNFREEAAIIKKIKTLEGQMNA